MSIIKRQKGETPILRVPIFRESAIPLYYQIENIIKEKINSGEYQPGDLLPTEEQLCNSFGVSRITVRKALSSLERDGLIHRKRGYGSIIRQGSLSLQPMKLTGSIEDLLAIGIKTRTRILHFGFISPPQNIAHHLQLEEDQQVLRIERIRYVKEGPLSYIINFIPFSLGKKVKARELIKEPLMNILEKKCNLKIKRAFQIIEATVADPQVAQYLEVPAGAPLLKVERTVYDMNDKPVEFLSVLYRSDRYHYSVELIREKKAFKREWNLRKPEIKNEGKA
ncbi:MAG: GntR family transcriptional regulator [Candidatus Anstonellales archaeon]